MALQADVLDAIRARDAEWADGGVAVLDKWAALMPAVEDRRTLLAEVDSLNDDKADLYRQLAYAGSSSREGERARIHKAVEALRIAGSKEDVVNDWQKGYRDSRNETVAFVLSIIGGEAGQ
jgi:uncharacterized coiled-coil DUF342 family protein